MCRIVFRVALLAAMMAVGCGRSGEPTVWVTGKLVKGGLHYDAPPGQMLTITFVTIEVQKSDGKMVPNTEPHVASFDQSSGKFTVPGRDGYGIPPGKYRVAITSKMERLALNTAKPKLKPMDREKDYLDGKFGEATSPIIREIKESTDLAIDMDKPAEAYGG